MNAPALPQPALLLNDVDRSFPDGGDQRLVLQGVSASIHPGEFVAVMGPSGSGKTTLLELIAGLQQPDRGEVWVGETRVSTASEAVTADMRRRQIGMVHQEHLLDPLLTVLENVALPLQLAGTASKKAMADAQPSLERCGVDRLNRRPSECSGGDRQRIAVARALVRQPNLLLADEPTAALDSVNARMVVELLRQAADEGVAVVMTTHDARMASYADRIFQLRDAALSSETADLASETRS